MNILLGQTSCSLPLCNLLLDLAGRIVMSLTDVSQLAQETVVQWGLILWLTCSLDVFRKELNNEVSRYNYDLLPPAAMKCSVC